VIHEQRAGTAGRVLVLTIDRPASRNALDGETMRELSTRFSSLAADVRAVVLTGASGTFVSGGDLRELSEVSDRASTEAFCDLGRQMCDAIEDAKVPVIAAIEGFALGGGAELACACDLRVAAADATLGFFQAKMAVTTAWGTFARLVAFVGVGRATDLLYRAHALSGLEALEMGLVEHVSARGEALASSVAMADDMARGARAALAGTKELATLARRSPELRELERRRFVETWLSPDHREAVAAFLEKRAPRFAP
jgi:enoyl-CoA hydratase